MLAILVFVVVVLGFALRAMSPEERVQFGRTVLRGLVFIKDAIAKPPSGGEGFYAALKARTRWTLVTPAIVATYLVVFVLLAGSGDLGDPRTIISWGGSIGPRTTNGEWWRLGAATFVHVGVIHLVAELAGLVQVGLVVERLVGRLAFAVVYAASGVLAGVWSLTLHPVSVQAGAAGAIFGVYGLLLASLVLGLAQRSVADRTRECPQGVVARRCRLRRLQHADGGCVQRSDAGGTRGRVYWRHADRRTRHLGQTTRATRLRRRWRPRSRSSSRLRRRSAGSLMSAAKWRVSRMVKSAPLAATTRLSIGSRPVE